MRHSLCENPVYEKCGKVVGITVQIMLLSDVGRRCQKHCNAVLNN